MMYHVFIELLQKKEKKMLQRNLGSQGLKVSSVVLIILDLKLKSL